jgi:hypothetical protein
MFEWLHPSAPPGGWHHAALPSGAARLAYPPGWRSIRSDPGTVSAALRTRNGAIEGYLNATPGEGAETLSNWSSFRPAHNRDEGDTGVSESGAAAGLRFRQGHGSCVIDAYTSSSSHRYREIACIVDGGRATTVVVGAAPTSAWQGEAPFIERAISSFQT